MLLDTTTRSIELLLGAAVTTNQLKITASWVDMTATTQSPATTTSSSNNTTPVTIVASPAASTQRKVMEITIFNSDTVSATVTVRVNDSSSLFPIVTFSIPTGQTLQYTDTLGWGLVASTVSIGPAGPTGATGPTGPTGPLASGFAGVNAQTGTTYTMVIGDAGWNITLNNASPITVTVPTHASVAFATGAVIGITQIGAGQVTISPAGGVTVNSASTLKTRVQYSICGLIYEGSDVWTFGGDMA